ncbi:MAG: DUF6206 family protein [Candidatus Marinimicrobia bacterium]|nr:DUF6206 family protein [Candidatus Neomarinimicrobiota bacterium]MCF7840511.1 DUF6206 family protein [Candidatus Neomarinimicrobiota bacterium]MCF7902243.1 DUF6206 family protein [Candidatus Neomarinimicrobiota bacterium]
MLEIDRSILETFEMKIDPRQLRGGSVLGYGEISTVLEITGLPDVACKRMPLFKTRLAADTYARQYREYCDHLIAAGLKLPDDRTAIIEQSGKPVVLYIIQQQLNPARFVHKLIHDLPDTEIDILISGVLEQINQIWQFNRDHSPNLQLAIDGQLSNWVFLESGDLYYVDTSTPLYRINGQEQLDPELFLQSAPSFLRWLIRWLFLADVMNRYYDPRQVAIDVAANLFKEQRPDLVPRVVELINHYNPTDTEPFTVKDIEKYYREDKLIWTLFLALRRFDRWLKTKILRQRYEFVLPGKIKR